MNELFVIGDYTLREVDDIVRVGIRRSFGAAYSHLDKYGAAWHAVIEALLTTAGTIPRSHLITIATDAARDEIGAQIQAYGAIATGGHGKEFGAGRGFNTYWSLPHSHSPDPAGPAIDRLALLQIWPVLAEQHRVTFGTFALADNDPHDAAAALNISLPAFQGRMARARAAFFALWHDGETPSRVWRQDSRRVRSTAPCGTVAAAQQHRKRREIRCAACVEAESVYYAARRAPAEDVQRLAAGEREDG
jgi:hypothetical protein